MGAVFGRGSWEIRIPDSQSLKDKRRVAHGIRDRLRARLKVSAAITDFADDRQRAEISVAFVSSDRAVARSLLDRADALVASDPRVYVTRGESDLS
jgi:uncharacterized protein YlxP (DUF503 family)